MPSHSLWRHYGDLCDVIVMTFWHPQYVSQDGFVVLCFVVIIISVYSVFIWYVNPYSGSGFLIYCQTSNIRCILAGNKLVDHSDVAGASPDRQCSNYIFILVFTPGLNGLGKDNCKTKRQSFNVCYLVHLILEILRYLPECQCSNLEG